METGRIIRAGEPLTCKIKEVHTASHPTYDSPRPSLDTSLPLVALQMALRQRRPPPCVLHHSDRGCQYAIAIFDYIERFHNRSRLHSALGFKSPPLECASNLN